MTQETAHMPLDERGLEAAADVSGLVERLRAACIGHPYAKIAWPHRLLHEAASTLQTLAASNAALEAENGRLRGEMQRIIDARSHAHRVREGGKVE